MSCGVSQEEYSKIKTENESLKIEIEKLNAELDEFRFGENRTVAIVEKAYSENDFSTARENIKILKEKHPESPKNKEFQKLLLTIERKEKEDQLRKEAEEKERIRLENLDNTGIWTIKYYVDDFGEPTKDGYITTSNVIKGLFSNTATQNSPLDVRFIITSSTDIDIKLFEYADNNPVKAYSPNEYTVLLQDGSGNKLRLKATNYSDRLSFDKNSSLKIHNAFMKSGVIKFRITEDATPTTVYDFDIITPDWYENAYRRLTGK